MGSEAACPTRLRLALSSGHFSIPCTLLPARPSPTASNCLLFIPNITAHILAELLWQPRPTRGWSFSGMNVKDREAWHAVVPGVVKSQTRLSD